jgi:branched-chain amino acid transport system substrate-binding protein
MKPLKKHRVLLTWLIIGTAGIAISACGDADDADPVSTAHPRSSSDEPISIAAGEPIRLGASMVLTGADGAAGIEETNAIVAAVNRWKSANGNEIGGHPIEIIVEDDGCTDVDATRVAAHRLLGTPGLVGVIGPSCSAGTEAVIDQYDDAGIILISGSATRTDLTANRGQESNFFRTIYRNELQGALSGAFVRDGLQATTAYVIDDGEAYGQDLVAAAQREMEARGVRVTHESVKRGQVDFAGVARRIADAAPGFVAFGGFNPEATLLYRQLRDAGYTGPFGAGDAAASIEDFVEPVGANEAEGVYFAGCPLTLSEDFAADYRSVNGVTPEASAFVAHTADAARILLDAVHSVAVPQQDGSLRINPSELRDAIRATHLLDGVSGHVRFDDNGDRTTGSDDLREQAIELGWVACQVQAGRLVQIFP